MLFIPENELEKALVRAVKEPQSAPAFYRLLLSSDLLVLGTVEGGTVPLRGKQWAFAIGVICGIESL